ncbi:Prolyl 4-hydroxylase alpha subunit 1 [Trichostrongylus colubriformis]|uniref:Prolyl 4-hydroxylase alpha subunit 1 n=1 Tax=Trichostrongylus colubriformis TaxID=6319 RepID=A0AAN8FZP8_TRICO
MQYILLLLVLLLVTTHADIFTSIADMQSVLQSEKFISAVLSEYIESEEDRLKYLKDLIKVRNEEAMKTEIKDFTSPINAFLFIKKKLFDWKRIEQAILVNNSRSLLESIAQRSCGVRYPTQEDLTGAAMGLLRLQDTYKLDTTDLADGRIYKKQGNYTFSAGDCFEIAKAAYNNDDFYHTVLWMEEARRRFEKEDVKTAKLSEILEYLSYSLYKQGNPKHALQLSEEIVTTG